MAAPLVDPLVPYRPPRLLAGLDVGQMSDPTALALMDREMLLERGQLEPRFLTRFLERVPLQTPYPTMVQGVKARILSLNERVALIIDATGVGKAIVDLFREAFVEREVLLDGRVVRHYGMRPAVISVTLTSGEQAHHETWDDWYVPKRDVIMAFQVALQAGRFRVARALPDAQTLVNEARNFQWKVSKRGDDQYGAWREGQHDDLLLACAIAVWWGTKYAPVQPTGAHSQRVTPPGNPLLGRRGVRR